MEKEIATRRKKRSPGKREQEIREELNSLLMTSYS
jgi:hypothetical protein